MQYDNGNYTFIAYGYFNNTFDGWSGYTYQGSFSPIATSYGIEMLNSGQYEGTYILPPNNGNIPEIPLIVEEGWYTGGGAGANIISLFGNTNNQVNAYNVGGVGEQYASVPNSSTFGEFYMGNGYIYLESAVTNRVLNSTYSSSLQTTGWWIYYSYLIVNSTYAEVGWYSYGYYSPSSAEFAPLTLLDMYKYAVYTNVNQNTSAYTYSNLNYNPFQYGTLEIPAGCGTGTIIYVEWVVARAYPPNGVMPSIYIG
jgi:hypothetical protein